jgi:ATP-dependent DNA helicase RecG
MAEELQRDDFSDLRVGLLHGAMGVGDREAVMEAFRSGEVHVLTATTVIEVGVDVPNATIMVIMNAERFGLAQLHQLRGRVGRGGDQSYCLLLTPAKYDPTGRLSPAGEESVSLARRRLAVMLDTTDGFAIAEEDLLLRGPGELYGTRQHGLPDFRLARLAGDLGVLTEAREAAFTLVDSDPDLKADAHRALRAPVAELRARMETPSG